MKQTTYFYLEHKNTNINSLFTNSKLFLFDRYSFRLAKEYKNFDQIGYDRLTTELTLVKNISKRKCIVIDEYNRRYTLCIKEGYICLFQNNWSYTRFDLTSLICTDSRNFAISKYEEMYN